MSLGSNIRQFRLAKKLTMKEVADAVGVTVSLISQIENDKANPSINTLLSISNVLGENIAHFFNEYSDSANAFVTRHQDLKPTGSTDNGRVQYYLTHKNLTELSVLRTVWEPGASTYKTPEHDHPSQSGYEFGYVLRGKLSVDIEGSAYLLEQGDAITFEAEKIHNLTNVNDGVTETIWVVIPGMRKKD